LAFSSGPYILVMLSLLYDYYIVIKKASQPMTGLVLPNKNYLSVSNP
jgi:hypothetical protein